MQAKDAKWIGQRLRLPERRGSVGKEKGGLRGFGPPRRYKAAAVNAGAGQEVFDGGASEPGEERRREKGKKKLSIRYSAMTMRVCPPSDI